MCVTLPGDLPRATSRPSSHRRLVPSQAVTWRSQLGRFATGGSREAGRALKRSGGAQPPCLRGVVALAALAGALTGCRTDVTVGVQTRTDGSGVVSVQAVLDRDAVAQAGDLTTLLRLSDLRAAGWQVVGPVPLPPGGRVEFRAQKPVASPVEAEAALRQISGEKGPFARLRVTRSRSSLQVSSKISGTIDLSTGYEGFGDDLLAQRLGTTSRLGVSDAQVVGRYGASLPELVPLHLTLSVPGTTKTFDLVPGTLTPVSLGARTWNTVLAVPAGALVAALGALALCVRLLRRR